MKFLLLLSVTLLSACASTELYNNEQIKTQCAIGYHQDQINAIVLFKSDSEDDDKENTSRFTEEFRCVPNSDRDKFIQHHNRN